MSYALTTTQLQFYQAVTYWASASDDSYSTVTITRRFTNVSGDALSIS